VVGITWDKVVEVRPYMHVINTINTKAPSLFMTSQLPADPPY